MKASEVMKPLRISRSTLYRLVKKGVIRARRLPNGRLDYDEKSVYEYLLKMHGVEPKRKTVIYARVSTRKQLKDLETRSNFWSTSVFHGVVKWTGYTRMSPPPSTSTAAKPSWNY